MRYERWRGAKMSSQIVRANVDSFLREIDFTTALLELQGFLERRVMVTVTADSCGASFVARLKRVESFPSEGSPVLLHFEAGEALELDPDLRTFLAGGPDQLRWLEFWADARTSAVMIDVILLPDSDP